MDRMTEEKRSAARTSRKVAKGTESQRVAPPGAFAKSIEGMDGVDPSLADSLDYYKSAMSRLYQEIETSRLEKCVLELDLFGYTVVPPEKVGNSEFTDRLVSRILEILEQRTGVKVDPESGLPAELPPDFPFGEWSPGYYHIPYLLFEGRVFEEALLNPTALTLATYLLGYHCVLDSCQALIKAADDEALALHTDQISPPPLTSFAQACNITWALSDYSAENGALCFVPGSHRLCRRPRTDLGEGDDQRVAVEASKGSLIVWHGNTWHGALPRRKPGVRINLIFALKRSYLQTTEAYRGRASKEVLDRNPPRFRTLMGDWLAYSRDTKYQIDNSYRSAYMFSAVNLV